MKTSIYTDWLPPLCEMGENEIATIRGFCPAAIDTWTRGDEHASQNEDKKAEVAYGETVALLHAAGLCVIESGGFAELASCRRLATTDRIILCRQKATLQAKCVSIAPYCPACGNRRGEPYPHALFENGTEHLHQRWVNPCGHNDTGNAVVAESNRIASIKNSITREAEAAALTALAMGRHAREAGHILAKDGRLLVRPIGESPDGAEIVAEVPILGEDVETEFLRFLSQTLAYLLRRG